MEDEWIAKWQELFSGAQETLTGMNLHVDISSAWGSHEKIEIIEYEFMPKQIAGHFS